MVDLEPLSLEDQTRVGQPGRAARGGHRFHRGRTDPDHLAAVGPRVREGQPRDYRRVLEATLRAKEEGRSVDEAVMAASHG